MEEKYFIATKEKEGLEEALERSNKEVCHYCETISTSTGPPRIVCFLAFFKIKLLL